MVNRNAVSTEPNGMHTQKNSQPTNFKVLQRENTVYKYYVELKEDVFTEYGYLDIAKVPGLRLTGANQFLKNLRIKNCLSRKDIAKIIRVSPECVKSWENNYSNIKLQTLVKIAENLGISRNIIYSMIDQGKFSTKNKISPKFKKISDIIQYFNPLNDDKARIVLLKHCPDETLSKIRETFKVKIRSHNRNWKIIYCRELHNLLKTFFRYIKVPKIHFPLTAEVKGWYDNGIDLKRAIIIPCLQSDGHIQHEKQYYSEVGFFGYNKTLHDYFVDAMYYEFNEMPSTYFKYCYCTLYSRKSIKKITDDVMNLAGNAKTSPAKQQTVEEYLKEPQPHLDYLINASEIEQQIALRIWSSTEGSINVYRWDKYVYPQLQIACAHPGLVEQLQLIARRLNINFCIKHAKRNWSEIGGLSMKALSSCIEFLKLGGFIKNVKISSHSPYHEGINKNILLLGILEYKKREQTNKELKNNSLQRIHFKINKIITNREYKSADYYINYFS